MRAELVYNKSTGELTLQNKEGNEVSLWYEIKSDTASYLRIILDIEDDPDADTIYPEEIE